MLTLENTFHLHESINGSNRLIHSWKQKAILKVNDRTSLVVQLLRLCAPNAGGPGLIPGQETISHMHAATKSSPASTKKPSCRN